MSLLGEGLVSKGLITKEQLDVALEKQKLTKDKLGKLLVKLGMINESTLRNFLSEQYNVPVYDKDILAIPVNVQLAFDFSVIEKYGIIPFEIKEREIYAGINDFNALSELDDISRKLGKKVVPFFFMDSMYDKIVSDLSKFTYGTKPYTFVSFQEYSKNRLSSEASFESLVRIIVEFDPSINHLVLQENEPPLVRKQGIFYKLPSNPIEKRTILEFIKELTDEPSRKKLVGEGFVKVKKSFAKGSYNVSIIKNKASYIIHVLCVTTNIPNFENLGFKNDILTHISQVPKGINLFIAPNNHGKSTVFASIINYYNKMKAFNIFSLEKGIGYEILSEESHVTQIECSESSEFSKKLSIAYDVEPDIVFVSDVPDIKTLEIILNLAESGVSVFVSLECSTITSAIEKMVMIGDKYSTHYLNRFADLFKIIVNFRLLPVKGIEKRLLVYEFVYNIFKLKKAIKEQNFSYINSQIKGTNDYIPLEKKLGELFLNGVIEYDVGDMFSSDKELYKNYTTV